MTHRKTKITHEIKYASPFNGRRRLLACETFEEVRRQEVKLLKKGHSEEDLVWRFGITNG